MEATFCSSFHSMQQDDGLDFDDEPFIRGGAIALPIAASLFATGLTMLIRRIKRRRALRREIHALESGALVSW